MNMWFPAWLGEVYAKLYTKFWEEPFTFQEAKNHLFLDENRIAVAFSKLHTQRVLLILDSGRPRQYRVMNPRNFLLLASDLPENLSKVPQERYIPLVCQTFREVYKGFDPTSMAVYSSVARGEAGEHSDVDLLIISNTFRGSLGSRVDDLYKRTREGVSDELRWLREHGIQTSLSFYPLTEEEAEKAPSYSSI